jgi:ribosomal protein S12 methylthiotransferase accessory factor
MINNDRKYRRLADLYDILVDKNIGVINQIKEIPITPGGPNFFHFSGKACDTSAFVREANFGNTGGASIHREAAVAKAVGEAVERYCSSIYSVDDFKSCSYLNTDFDCVEPGEFALHTKDQCEQPGFPWTYFDKNTPVRWAPGTDLVTGETVHVPAAFVYVPYIYYEGTGDTPIAQPISTGLSCHCSLPEAAYGGICEVVERDSFTLMWQAKMGMPQVRIETLSDVNYNMVERFEKTGDKVTIFNITTDLGIPCFLSVLRNDHPDAPALVFAASSDLDHEVAIAKSLEELAHTRRYSQQIKDTMPPVVIEEKHENIVSQADHLNFWCAQNNMEHAEFIFKNKERQDFEEYESLSSGNSKEDVKTLVSLLSAKGHKVIISRLTSDDIEPLGLEVVRAIVPGLNPLYMGHPIRALRSERLLTVPQKMGYRGVDILSGDNPWPHPYP